MKFMKFDEYLNSKGKTLEKAKVDVSGDNVDPMQAPNAPEGGGNPYVAKGVKNDKGTSKALGEIGDDITNMPKSLYDTSKKPAKLPTVDEVALVSKITNAISENPVVAETFVRSLKNQGLLGVLVAETLGHKETYQHLSECMSHDSFGSNFCSKLLKAMNEEVAPSFHDQLDNDEEEDEDEDMEDDDEDEDMEDDDEDEDMEDDDEDEDMEDDEDME